LLGVPRIVFGKMFEKPRLISNGSVVSEKNNLKYFSYVKVI
jgi:hypothetical protein